MLYTRHLLTMLAFFTLAGCYMGVTMPHKQRPGLQVGIILR